MADLLETQRRLQGNVDVVVRSLHLNELLSKVGRVTRVGSSAMGLMVRRDIDITVACPKLDIHALEAFSGIGARLMQMTESVAAVVFLKCTRMEGPMNACSAGSMCGLETSTLDSSASWAALASVCLCSSASNRFEYG